MRYRYTTFRFLLLAVFLLVTLALMVWFVVTNVLRAQREGRPSGDAQQNARPESEPRDLPATPSPAPATGAADTTP